MMRRIAKALLKSPLFHALLLEIILAVSDRKIDSGEKERIKERLADLVLNFDL